MIRNDFIQRRRRNGFAFKESRLLDRAVFVAAIPENGDFLRAGDNGFKTIGEGKLGELVPGAHADLLVVDGDPYADLSVFRNDGSGLAAIMLARSGVTSSPARGRRPRWYRWSTVTSPIT